MSMVRVPDTAFALDRSSKDTRRVKCPKHLAFIRLLPSIVSGRYGVEACHIRFGDPRNGKTGTGMGRKPHDRFVLPLTPEEHRDQHSTNERLWWTRQGIEDPCGIALALYAVTGDQEEAEKLIAAIHRRMS